MGTWGVSLYGNDTACDARDTWLKKLKQGATGEQATEELLAEQKGIDDDPLFWLALADTQWTWGRLEARVLEQAERALAAGGDLALWEEKKGRAARVRVFDRLAARLEKPPPPPRPVRVRGDAVPWKRGQLWAYHTLDDKYVVFRIAGFDPTSGLVGAPVTELLDIVLDALPPTVSPAEVGVKTARPDYNSSGRYDFYAPEHRASPMFQPKVKRRGELPRHRLKKLRAEGTPRPATRETKATGVPWDGMDHFLSRIFAVGGLRSGAVLRWPLADGDVAYTMVEFGHWADTLINPMWQLAVLDCRGDGVDAAAIEKANVVRRIIVDGFQPPGLTEVGYRPIESADQVSGAVYRWDDVPRTLDNRRMANRPATMNMKEAREVLASYLEERWRPRSYAELETMLGDQGTERVTGPSGAPYVVEIHVVWEREDGVIRVMGGLDDGRAEAPVFPFQQSFIVKASRPRKS